MSEVSPPSPTITTLTTILSSPSKYILICAPPGCGKTYMINQIHDSIKLAPTWSSAELIDGETIYHYCGCSFLKLLPTKTFTSPIICVDEVFMFQKHEMKTIIQCMDQNDTQQKLIMFGDPYQIKQQSTDYFYNAFEELNLPITKFTLTQYHRCQDVQLKNILEEYRVKKETPSIILPFIILKNLQQVIEKVVRHHHTILVGNHKVQQYYQIHINKHIYKSGIAIMGRDGNIYRTQQQIFSISRYGSLQHKYFISKIDADGNVYANNDAGEEKIFLPTLQNGKFTYQFVSGDVITVNVAQGRTLTGVICDMRSFFEFGSFYTAVSRVQKIQDISIINQPSNIFQVDLNNKYCYDM